MRPQNQPLPHMCYMLVLTTPPPNPRPRAAFGEYLQQASQEYGDDGDAAADDDAR